MTRAGKGERLSLYSNEENNPETIKNHISAHLDVQQHVQALLSAQQRCIQCVE